MPARLLAFCAMLLATAQPLSAGSLSADDYIALRKSLGATSAALKAARSNPSAYVGKAIELTGTVNGVARCGSTASLIINCAGDSHLVTASELPECVANGNTIRVLARIGPGSVASLSDLRLQGAAYDFDVTKREKELAAKAAKPKSAPTTQKKQPATTTSRLGRGSGLSSRALQVFEPYRKAIKRFNSRLSEQQLDTITASILAYSEHYGIDPRLIVAVILAESHFRTNATSPKGAMGLGQLMPGTARGLGVANAYDPVQNIAGCIKLMRGHLDRQGDLSLALACYNAGSGAVKKYGGVPPYRETQNYVWKVTEIYRALCGK